MDALENSQAPYPINEIQSLQWLRTRLKTSKSLADYINLELRLRNFLFRSILTTHVHNNRLIRSFPEGETTSSRLVCALSLPLLGQVV